MQNISLPLRMGKVERINVIATSTQSTACDPGVYFFRIIPLTGSGFFFVTGTNPTATANHTFINNGAREHYYEIYPGEKIALIRNSVDCTVQITWMTR